MKIAAMLLPGLLVAFLLISQTTAGVLPADGDLAMKCTCPRIFSPVCAVDNNGRRRVVANECTAVCEGYTILNTGLCLPI